MCSAVYYINAMTTKKQYKHRHFDDSCTLLTRHLYLFYEKNINDSNHMLYADDLCIVSLSFAGLQKLLSIYYEYCARTFNEKSVCMFFQSTVNKHCDNSTVFLSGNQIDFVQKVRYLGVFLIFSM